jgi:hypothetical protein
MGRHGAALAAKSFMATDCAAICSRRVRKGVAAGVLATALMSGLLSFDPAFGRAGFPEVGQRALAALRAHPSWALFFLALHFIYGGAAGALFSLLSDKPTAPRGLIFGLLLWGVALVVYAPLLSMGFLGRFVPLLGPFLLPSHLLFGATLGFLLAGPPPRALRAGDVA